MMIKLIAIDLDGSLLDDNKNLPKDFWEAADKLFQKKINIVIASGRPFHNISSVFDPIKDKIYFACDNGSYVVHANEELLVNQLDPASIKGFVEISRPIENVYPVLCSKHVAYIENTEEVFTSQALKYYQEYKVVEDLTKVDDIILKISLCDLAGSETNSYPFYKQFENDFKVAVAGAIWLDITNIDGSKGTAIKTIQERLKVSSEETLVFGDYLNDMDMIQNAGYSYAMKNAHPEILKAAKYITELDNNNGGVTHTIKQLIDLS
ncbi:HAD family hydrolase [Niabella ginsengisoli]|uniref:Cof-type HAD-IIB family hydrolase n=1 Tax=Niabella ginsengisoli TaxID=522298 RepID=A0ABS9SP98_9BACT|nr:HAD family hydrolase [Niabella ginsengisoli]MCH5600233.1 Cof-type HAD-IIB family hydrolase [Niabella ginsengisoli]